MMIPFLYFPCLSLYAGKAVYFHKAFCSRHGASYTGLPLSVHWLTRRNTAVLNAAPYLHNGYHSDKALRQYSLQGFLPQSPSGNHPYQKSSD